MKIDPEGAGFHPARLERITEHLDRNYIQPAKIAGCQTLVARGSTVAYFRSQGRMAIEAEAAPVPDDAIWRIYSMSKPITSVALMTLFEKGVFQLDDPVSRWIPELGRAKVKAGRDAQGERIWVDQESPITVRHVLSHTGGLSYGNALDSLVSPGSAPAGRGANSGMRAVGGDGTLAQLMGRLEEMGLNYQPGTAWEYSFSTDVCARLVECMAGQSFDEYLQAEIFDPLGMVDTAFSVPEDQLHRFPSNYIRLPSKELRLVDSAERSTYRTKPTFLSGGGGLVSTAADYLRFTAMLANGGEVDGVRILGRQTIELMTRNHLPGGQTLAGTARGLFSETAYDGIGFGLGFAMTLDPVVAASPTEGDYYWGGAASTIFWVDPRNEISVIFMTQLMPSAVFNFRGQLKNIVYGALAS